VTGSGKIAAALSDRYLIEREIGAGGMATVYLAKDLKHDRDVALKILRADLSAVLGGDRFLNEVRITARLDHPHILTLIDSGEAGGVFYYVLPLVRGESLRAKLEREKQLGLDEALSITRQIAAALDYAHKQGVVHRDIKPENILLHEGEAMLADFGIALAVKEAGGNRLTETGLSLGTPQYMSPEQATGDRSLDARSDIYSLGAVLYEMLAGEAPVTGATAQAMIAKLMTERPTRLRVIRDTVPEGIDNAVARALAKVPADRFASAGEFAAAIAAGAAQLARPAAGAGMSRATQFAVIAGVAAVASIAAVVVARRAAGGSGHAPAAALRDRRQLTTTGRVTNAHISGDGKQLAYVVPDCSGGTCRYAIDLQDVGGTATRRLFDGATALYDITWSPDRRNLLFEGSVGSRYGEWLISALGGTPRWITANDAAFWAGGDSLLTVRSAGADSVYWIDVAGLDGVPRDSIRLAEPGRGIGLPGAVPNSGWIVVSIRQQTRREYLVIDRAGRVTSRLSVPSFSAGAGPSADALWIRIQQSGVDPRPPLVRVPFDAQTGRLADRQDTVYTGQITSFSVTADGGSLVLDEGTAEYGIWAVDFRDALRGVLADSRRVLQTTTRVSAQISPPGDRLLILRDVEQPAAQMAVMPFAGGPETPAPTNGTPTGAYWADSASIAIGERRADGLHVSLADARTGQRRNDLLLPDSAITDFAPVGDGWAWLTRNDLNISVQRPGELTPRRWPQPDWYASLIEVRESSHGQLAVMGWKAVTNDSLGISVLNPADSSMTQWAAMFGEDGGLRWLPDQTMLVWIWTTQESLSLYRLRGPGRIESIGTVGRSIYQFRGSDDLRRAAVVVRNYHGDAWMSRVVRP